MQPAVRENVGRSGQVPTFPVPARIEWVLRGRCWTPRRQMFPGVVVDLAGV